MLHGLPLGSLFGNHYKILSGLIEDTVFGGQQFSVGVWLESSSYLLDVYIVGGTVFCCVLHLGQTKSPILHHWRILKLHTPNEKLFRSGTPPWTPIWTPRTLRPLLPHIFKYFHD